MVIPDGEENNYSLKESVTTVFQYLSIIIAAIGCVTNFLSFLVFSRNRFRNFSFSFYSRVILCTDSFVLLHSFRHFVNKMTSHNIDTFSIGFCKLSEYSVYSVASISVWTLSINSLDRVLKILSPNKFSFFKKKSFQISAVCLIALFSWILYSPMFFYSDLKFVKSNNLTNASQTIKQCELNDKISAVIYWIDFINSMTVTLVINNLLTCITVISIFRSRKKVVLNGKSSKRIIRDRKFAITSIALDISCFITKLPLLLTLVITQYVIMNQITVDMLFTISVFIYTVDAFDKFYVYYFVNSIFKEEFLRMMNIAKYNDALIYQSTRRKTSRS